MAGFIQAHSAPRPPAGSFETYRAMRGNPTVALARIAATAPVRAAEWTLQADADAPAERVEFIRSQLQALWPMLVKDILYALDYGFQAFEKVFELQGGRLVYRKIKPLAPQRTEILVDEATGAFAGLRQGDVVLPAEKCFLFTYDGEAGNFYGRSRHENIREHAWAPWMDLSAKRGQYFRKVAGVVPVIEYPEGTSQDESGATRSNFDLARSVLQNLGSGKGVAMPNVFARYAGDFARGGVDLEQLKAWHISFLETSEQHGGEFTETMRHLESLMLRGWLVPERAVSEGQYGTKAEAGEHARVVLAAADLLLQDVLRHVNWYLVDPLLALNFGRESAGTVRVTRGGLTGDQQTFFRDLVSQVLSSGPNAEMLLKLINLEALLDSTGLPSGSA